MPLFIWNSLSVIYSEIKYIQVQESLVSDYIWTSAVTVDGYQWKSSLCSSQSFYQSFSEGSTCQYFWKWYVISIIVLFSMWLFFQPQLQKWKNINKERTLVTCTVFPFFYFLIKTSYPIAQRLFAMRRYGGGILYLLKRINFICLWFKHNVKWTWSTALTPRCSEK